MSTHTTPDSCDVNPWGGLVTLLCWVGVFVLPLIWLTWFAWMLSPDGPPPANSHIASYPGALYTTCVNSANVAVDPSSCGVTPAGSLSSPDPVLGQAITDWQDGRAVTVPGAGYHPLKTTVAVAPGTKVSTAIVVNLATGQTLARSGGRLTGSGITPRSNNYYDDFDVSGLTGWFYCSDSEYRGTTQNILTHRCG